MSDIGQWLNTALTWEVGGPWPYVLTRTVLLFALGLTIWRARRMPWVALALSVSFLLLGARMLADLLTGGRPTSLPLYDFLAHVVTMLVYLTATRLIDQLANAELAQSQAEINRDVYRTRWIAEMRHGLALQAEFNEYRRTHSPAVKEADMNEPEEMSA